MSFSTPQDAGTRLVRSSSGLVGPYQGPKNSEPCPAWCVRSPLLFSDMCGGSVRKTKLPPPLFFTDCLLGLDALMGMELYSVKPQGTFQRTHQRFTVLRQ